MDFSKYDVSDKKPMKGSYTTTFYYSRGKLVATWAAGAESPVDSTGKELPTSSLHSCLKETCVDEQRLHEDLCAFYNWRDGLFLQFKEDVFAELGISQHPHREMLWNMCVSECGTNSFPDLYLQAEHLAQLLQIPDGAILVTSGAVFRSKKPYPIQDAVKIDDLIENLRDLL